MTGIQARRRVLAALILIALLLSACSVATSEFPAVEEAGLQQEKTGEDEPGQEDPRVTVPKVEGKKLAKARRTLRQAGLRLRVMRNASSKPAGTVLSQRPTSGADVQPGRVIRLVIAKPKPPPPPAAPSCHPSYVGACLDPTASDYDCAGGSGNGPLYTGTVQVVGYDEYGLDADGDGVGCE
jgi:hypothetical protein